MWPARSDQNALVIPDYTLRNSPDLYILKTDDELLLLLKNHGDKT
jgi:hypothetical protein